MSAVDIDQSLIEAYRAAAADVVSAEATLRAIRTIIETLIGDEEYATVHGEPVIRWMQVTSRRLDMDTVRKLVDPAVLAECYVETTSRQFRLLKPKDGELL